MMTSLELSARYSLMPNRLGYCGCPGFASIFRDYLQGKATASRLKSALKKFKGNYPYLKTIARANGIKNPFDRRVIEAFWIGNGLLNRVPQSEIKKLIMDEFVKKAGMGEMRAHEKAKNLPKGILLHHSFNSLYLNFVGNKVARTVSNFDKCRIGWGKAVSVSNRYATINYRPIKKNKNKKFHLARPINKRFLRSVGGITPEPNLRKGDSVSMHWGLAVQRLNKDVLKALERYTLRNIRSINRI